MRRNMRTFGCKVQLVNNAAAPLTPRQVQEPGCHPDDRVELEALFVADLEVASLNREAAA
jgi:hypothetical protein